VDVENLCASSRLAVYSLGMIVSDIRFPTENRLNYPRFLVNQQRIVCRELGFSMHSNVDLFQSRQYFIEHMLWSDAVIHSKIGLVLCEHPWPLDRRVEPSVPEWHARVVLSLMGQWTHATCIVMLRNTDAVRAMRVLRQQARFAGAEMPRRIMLVPVERVNVHYIPQTLAAYEDGVPIWNGDVSVAIVIHPTHAANRLVANDDNVYVPELVFRAMIKQHRATLQLSAWTLDSTLVCHQYLKGMKSLYHMP